MTTLINGEPCDTISVNERGFLYGDGVFRTLRLSGGRALHWSRHYAKLVADCSALELACPPEHELQAELSRLAENVQEGVVKITVTRGIGPRGYTPPRVSSGTHLLSLNEAPRFPEHFATRGVALHLCHLRLGHQPRLAGIKHLNRLENVLAAMEWDDPLIAEGLLLDESGYVIEAVRSNVFMVKDGRLSTPDLSRCGVAGVQRERVLDCAKQHGMDYRIRDILLDELLLADEIFLVNSVYGLWPVKELPGYHCIHHPVAHLIRDWLNHDSD